MEGIMSKGKNPDCMLVEKSPECKMAQREGKPKCRKCDFKNSNNAKKGMGNSTGLRHYVNGQYKQGDEMRA